MNKLKVLIVDDNPTNIQIVGNILIHENLDFAFATSGLEAIKLTHRIPFDLILLDIRMPGMDGFELCTVLRKQPETKETPIIFLTAMIDESDIIKGFLLGANDYVKKPFNGSELVARVNTHLELSGKRKQLDELNVNLAKMVEERTKELELANKKLLILEKAKSEFLSIISHELRAPLSNLIGLTTLFEQTNLSNEQRQYIDSLSNLSKRFARFSQMALLITTLQTRNKTVEIFPILASVIIELAVDEVRYQLNSKQIEITQYFENDKLLLYSDADLIRKCITILIENAISLLPEKGKIAISLFENEMKQVCITVSDNGAGFEPEALKVINDFFINRQTESREGVGLSLTAVKLIMDAHNGSIVINNLPEGGAEVCLFFNPEN